MATRKEQFIELAEFVQKLKEADGNTGIALIEELQMDMIVIPTYVDIVRAGGCKCKAV
jgi:hypothetical protein